MRRTRPYGAERFAQSLRAAVDKLGMPMLSFRVRAALCPCGQEFEKTQAPMRYCESCREQKRRQARPREKKEREVVLTDAQRNVMNFMRNLPR